MRAIILELIKIMSYKNIVQTQKTQNKNKIKSERKK